MRNRWELRRRARLPGTDRFVPDAVTLLTVYLIVLYAIPSNRVISDLGSAGSVGVLFGLGAAILWTVNQVQGTDRETPGARPVRFAVVLFLFVSLASYIVAMTRPLPPQELTIADTGLIRLIAWAGILLLAHDGVPSMDRLVTLLRRFVVAGTLLAILGVTQFITRLPMIDVISIPGLQASMDYASVETRGGLVRAAGTSIHPLEYTLVLAMAFPLALTLALRRGDRPFLSRWLPVGLILLGLTLSGSRSAVIGIVAGVVILIPTWSRTIRWRLALSAIVLLALVYAAAPRVITNMRYMFLAIFEDPSAASRADSLGVFTQLFAVNPILGRGFGTFLPQYRILDNQYFLLILETGILGVCAFLLICLTAVVGVIRAGRTLADTRAHDLGFALAGSVIAGATLLFLFDALSFPQSAGTIFLVLGLCGAYWRLARENLPAAHAHVELSEQERIRP
ncbi:O-antigen ligase domain-containing protein [Cryobacterium melibiosiphilum]|uniref:O-antigen ligase domain-containing protein n=1 Tax=Cryobacterium melibiosiphilum TaxID=995039 RepID=A0A3A5MJJ9_9MICO|nr:O-antigen ligase family protein [Cryobacterium melibiosiphilum]RJT89592.1 O-antigen ligase domain-containing protein [Cryobacterium melibiosiphilum]